MLKGPHISSNCIKSSNRKLQVQRLCENTVGPQVQGARVNIVSMAIPMCMHGCRCHNAHDVYAMILYLHNGRHPFVTPTFRFSLLNLSFMYLSCWFMSCWFILCYLVNISCCSIHMSYHSYGSISLVD